MTTKALEVGARYDAGDAETGAGVEVGFADAGLGLTVEANARALLAHEGADYAEWGAAGDLGGGGTDLEHRRALDARPRPVLRRRRHHARGHRRRRSRRRPRVPGTRCRLSAGAM